MLSDFSKSISLNTCFSLPIQKEVIMKVKEIMENAVLISPNTSKKDLLKLVRKHPHVELFIVVDKKKRFLGDISEDDLFYMMIPNDLFGEISGARLGFDLERKFFSSKAKEIMRKHDITCNEDDEFMDAVLTLARAEINEMPVLNKKEQVVGVVNQGTFLRHLKL